MSAHYVYRVYDADGHLIYVGCTQSLPDRMKVHQATSWWAPQAVKIRGTVFPSRREAMAAEAAAIRAENPRWNIKGRFTDHATWSEADFVDYVTALVNAPGSSPARVRHIHAAARRFCIRFDKRIPLELPPHPDGSSEDRWISPRP